MAAQGAHALVLESAESDRLFDSIRSEVLDEYRQNHEFPWIIGYSGGKDSTLVLHLVFEMLISLPPSQRTRPVHVVANDTLVESPLVMQHIATSLQEIEEAVSAFDLPVMTQITQPALDQSFWVNLIGRGYPSPNRSFRWCTDRMKIRPTSQYIKSQVDATGQVVLLLGVRRSESAARSGMVARYDNGERLHPHADLNGCMIFRPIVELSTEDVWEFLALHPSPWGGTHQNLIRLYRDAGGGECPVVTQKSDAPSCGTTSSRFGCWTCTVVEKDRSLEGFVEAGFSEFGPLLDFRDWLASTRNEPNRRQARRRDGSIMVTEKGTLLPGPYTLEARMEILDRLLALQEQVEGTLISEEEIDTICELWSKEVAQQTDAPSICVRELKRKEK